MIQWVTFEFIALIAQYKYFVSDNYLNFQMNLIPKLTWNLSKQISMRAYSNLPSELVVFMDDNMVVCWHPEQPFPYKYSKPLPVKLPEPESVLKIGEKEIKTVFRNENKAILPEELAKITYTTRNVWYPRARDKKAKKTVPDRPYM